MRSLNHFRRSVQSTRSSILHATVSTLLAASVVLAACSPSDTFRALRGASATPYDRYAQALRDAGLDSTALGREWLAASDSALRTPFAATLPARELGIYTRSEARAVAYRIALRDGQRLRTTVRADGPAARLYLDLFEVTTDTARPFAHRATAATMIPTDSAAAMLTLDYEATSNTEFVLRLQPELLRSGRFEVTMQAEPILAFPVEGLGNGAIQSFFGATREGGSRSHHGIDIFAPRGTPVLAATDGFVRSISPNSLGGNVVWLTDERRRQTLYYAHLDRHAVSEGARVRVGDTLGFVGTTGNARTTAPHLHFGMYRRGQGPVDPLPYVRLVLAKPPALTADTIGLGREAETRVANTPLRESPSASSIALRRIPRATVVQIMGVSANWYRVQFADGTGGYLAAGALRLTGDSSEAVMRVQSGGGANH